MFCPSTYFTCVGFDFVNVYFAWELRVMVDKMGKLGRMIFIAFKAVASPAKLFFPRLKGITFK